MTFNLTTEKQLSKFKQMGIVNNTLRFFICLEFSQVHAIKPKIKKTSGYSLKCEYVE